jgi:pseudo-rSAM protein
MIATDKKYWLYIAPHVYCQIKGACLLLYNTKIGTFIESTSKEIITLIQSLHKKQNLGAISIEGTRLIEEPYCSFIEEFCEKSIGNIIDIADVPKKPIQLMPIVNLQRDRERLQENSPELVSEEFLYYLSELNLYLNQTCDLNCPHCDHYFRQTPCCTRNKANDDFVSLDILETILKQIENAAVGKLNILGGNLLQYPYLKSLQKLLLNFKELTQIWVHYANIANNETSLPDFQYVIPVTFPIDEKLFVDCVTRMKDKLTNYHFIITNTEEYEKLEQLLKMDNIRNYSIHPFYTKNNLAFFEDLIYLNKEDIFCETIPFRRIFAHQKLNTNFFGSLTVLPNGNVYANVNQSALGNIKADLILDLIGKEMHINTSWRVIRDQKPCNQCLYQYLCPSPSSYETVIGKPNLCHIKA